MAHVILEMGMLAQWPSKALLDFGFGRGSSRAAHFLGFDCAFLHCRQLVRNVACGKKIITCGNSFPCPINELLVPMSLTQCLPLDTHGACGCGHTSGCHTT